MRRLAFLTFLALASRGASVHCLDPARLSAETESAAPGLSPEALGQTLPSVPSAEKTLAVSDAPRRSLGVAAFRGALAVAVLFLIASCARFIRRRSKLPLGAQRRLATAACGEGAEGGEEGEGDIHPVKGLLGSLETPAPPTPSSLDSALQRQSALVYRYASALVEGGLFVSEEALEQAVREKLKNLEAELAALKQSAGEALEGEQATLAPRLDLVVNYCAELQNTAEAIFKEAEASGDAAKAEEAEVALAYAHSALLGALGARQFLREGASALESECRAALRRAAHSLSTAIQMMGDLGIAVSVQANAEALRLTETCEIFDRYEENPEDTTAQGSVLLFKEMYFLVSRRLSTIGAGVEKVSDEVRDRLSELQRILEKGVSEAETTKARVVHGAFVDAKLGVLDALVATRDLLGKLTTAEGSDLVVVGLAARAELLRLMKKLVPLADGEHSRTCTKLDVMYSSARARSVGLKLLRAAREWRSSADLEQRERAEETARTATEAFRLLLKADKELGSTPRGMEIPKAVILDLQKAALEMKKLLPLIRQQFPNLAAEGEAAGDQLVKMTMKYLSARKL